ncbi:hypothetical protein MUK42_36294 [Musa troglodytarum]|uniref:Uncharacterized protein n=1 Tax=Musa troglodytarum TaxID=320322 RepID=A0A9E7EHD9_9LILI|nr:hypothetical protein MUK42_36294 [Musa troglodytarum]
MRAVLNHAAGNWALLLSARFFPSIKAATPLLRSGKPQRQGPSMALAYQLQELCLRQKGCATATEVAFACAKLCKAPSLLHTWPIIEVLS